MARNRYLINLVFLPFFAMSPLTNISEPIVPEIFGSFHIILTADDHANCTA